MLVDVKQADDKNMSSGNFSIPSKEVNELLQEAAKLKKKTPARAFAFRLAEGNAWTDNFLYVGCKDLMKLLNGKDAY